LSLNEQVKKLSLYFYSISRGNTDKILVYLCLVLNTNCYIQTGFEPQKV